MMDFIEYYIRLQMKKHSNALCDYRNFGLDSDWVGQTRSFLKIGPIKTSGGSEGGGAGDMTLSQ